MWYAFDQLSPGKHNSLPQCWASVGPVVIVNQCSMCGFPLSNIWHVFSSKKMILKAIILQNQSVSYIESANRKTPQNESEKKACTVQYSPLCYDFHTAREPKSHQRGENNSSKNVKWAEFDV